jgi:hypothetical protein
MLSFIETLQFNGNTSVGRLSVKRKKTAQRPFLPSFPSSRLGFEGHQFRK